MRAFIYLKNTVDKKPILFENPSRILINGSEVNVNEFRVIGNADYLFANAKGALAINGSEIRYVFVQND